MVVMPDAVIDKTVDGIIGSAFGAAGQRCMAGSVVVTVGEAHDQLMPPLREAAAALRVGDGARRGHPAGPGRLRAARERIVGGDRQGRRRRRHAWLSTGARRGAGGGQLPRARRSSTRSSPDTDAAREEIFGPVLSVDPARPRSTRRSRSVNGSRFGNGVSIFTESGASVRRFRHEVQAGMVGVNIGVAAPVAFFPFSGWKDSFLGDLHAHGTDAVDFYTRKKTVTSRWFSSGQGTGPYFVES